MKAVYAESPNIDDPISRILIGDRPEPSVPEGWVRVRMTHVSLNRHDLFTLRGLGAHPEPIPFPMILGNDGAGTLDDGTPVVIYPLISEEDRLGEEPQAPDWHVFSEKVPGTMAQYVAVPRRNAVPLPEGLSPLHASVLGTAWLTAYRSLFSKSSLRAGETLLIQGASGGMSTALIQMGRAAGFEIWVTTRSQEGRAIAERLGAHRVFDSGAALPRRVDAVVDNVGAATWRHSLESVRRGGTVVITGVTTGMEAPTNLLRLFTEEVTVKGAIMGTLKEFQDMMAFIVASGIEPEIGKVMPMEEVTHGLQTMWDGDTKGKFVVTIP